MSYTYGKSRPQVQWRGGKAQGQRTMSTKENTESVQELIFNQESQSVEIDQCVKLQEKPTKIITVTILLCFRFSGQHWKL